MDEISAGAVQLKPEYIVGLSVLATVGLVSMWGLFWHSVAKSQENVMDILRSPFFFQSDNGYGSDCRHRGVEFSWKT